jgi:hypothetical protein
MPSIQPEIIENKGKYTFAKVPIFAEHERDTGNDVFICDKNWMERCVEKMKSMYRNGFSPRVIIGHNDPESYDEKPNVGFLENFFYDYGSGTLYADLVDITKEVAESIKNNIYPGRSVEVHPEDYKITALALLGSNCPYLAGDIPDIRYSQKDNAILYSYSKFNYGETQMDEQDFEDKKMKDNEMNKTLDEVEGEDSKEDQGSDFNTPDIDEAEFDKFKNYMSHYMKLHGRELAKQFSYREDEAPEDAKPVDNDKQSDKSVSDKTVNTPELVNGKDTKDYTEKLPECVEKKIHEEMKDKKYTGMGLESDLYKKEYSAQREYWTVQYKSLKAPITAVDVAKEVKHTLTLSPKERISYFSDVANYVANFESPKKVEALKNAKLKTDNEDAAAEKFYRDNKAKFKDLGEAMIVWNRIKNKGM